MRKLSRRLNALQLFFLAAGGALAGLVGFAGTVIASTPVVVDDFESYTNGTSIAGQGSWDAVNSNLTVSTSQAHGGTKSAVCNFGNTCYFWVDGLNITTGYMDFWFYPTQWQNFANQSMYFDGAAFQVNFYGNGSGGVVLNDTGHWYDGFNLVMNTWQHIIIEFNATQYRFSPDGGGTWSAWANHAGSPVSSMQGYGNNSRGFFVDDFISQTITGYDPVLTPTTPPRNVETIVDFDDPVAVSGTIAIPTNNTHAYDNLKVLFYKPNNAFPAETLNIPLSLTGGQSYAYSATTTIAVSGSGNNFFKVAYNLSGRTYAGSYLDNPVISMPLLPFDNTWIKDSVSSAPASILNQATLPTQEALEDCDAYSGIDAVVCRFKNFIMGAFLPSNDALAQISGTMDALKTKFPINYASAISSSFGTIAAQVDDNSGFTFSLYGNSGTADTSFFTQDLGGGITIGGTIKLILTFFVFMLFLLWGLNYMHRVLK